jgi:formate dehydrogenase beta subunit
MAKVILGSWRDDVTDNRGLKKSVIPETFKGLKEFESGNDVLAFMGWDGFFLFDRDVPVVDMARAYVEKVQSESCGYCTPCRVGTKVVAEKLAALADGHGRREDIDAIKSMAEVIRDASMCELGHTSMTALLKMMEMIPEAFEEAIAGRAPVKRGNYRAMATAPCIEACPAHLDIPEYVDAIRSGNYYESLAIIGRKNPLAGVCGRVCVRPCEFVCRREELDEPISIKHLKRFVNDQIMSYAAARSKPLEEIPATSGKKAAIIGAGPCGLTAAFYLKRKGHEVHIFEDLQEPGGMSAVGIPDYRLPRDVIRSEVRRISEIGVNFHYGKRLGRDLPLSQLESEYDTVLISVGAHGSKSVGMDGESSNPDGYVSGVTFLRDLNLLHHIGEFKPPEGTRVVVVGGGNVAMDCARSAVRLGYSKVSVVYRRTQKEMPADHEEIEGAMEEGVEFLFLTHPVRIDTENEKVKGITCVKMDLGEPDASGRRRPVEVKGSDFSIECDIVIPAIGQSSDFSFLTEGCGIETTKWGTIAVDDNTMMTSRDRVFAGGDCVSGPAALIDAMGHGLRVAHCMDQRMRGEKMCMPEPERMFRLLKTMSLPQAPVNRLGNKARCRLDMRPADERTSDFVEIEHGLKPEEAIREAERCLRCYRIALFATEE